MGGRSRERIWHQKTVARRYTPLQNKRDSSDFPKAWMKYLLEKILCLVIWPPSKPVFTSHFLFWKSSNLQKCWKNSAIKHPCTHYLDSSIINILLYLLFLSFSLTYTQTHIYTNITHILIVFKSHLKLSCWRIS